MNLRWLGGGQTSLVVKTCVGVGLAHKSILVDHSEGERQMVNIFNLLLDLCIHHTFTLWSQWDIKQLGASCMYIKYWSASLIRPSLIVISLSIRQSFHPCCQKEMVKSILQCLIMLHQPILHGRAVYWLSYWLVEQGSGLVTLNLEICYLLLPSCTMSEIM